MPLSIIRNDITVMQVDAIVNAANTSLLGGGGVDGCIHRAAGPELLEECRTLNGCETGRAKITKGYLLPAKYVIHTVGPIWHDGTSNEEALLRSCYRESLQLARDYKCESIAFPLISAGVYRYPKAQALKIAIEEISNFLLSSEEELQAYIVIFDKKSYQISEKLLSDVKQYVDDNYVDLHSDPYSERMRRMNQADFWLKRKKSSKKSESQQEVQAQQEVQSQQASQSQQKTQTLREFQTSQPNLNLDHMLAQIDESFSQMLLRKIDEKGMTDAQCYKKANIDRKLFSKIKNDVFYKPSKTTVIAFAIALELSIDEAKEMLLKAGFALSHSNKFDIIIEYFFMRKNYNIYEINEVLFAFDQVLLGV